MVCAEVVIANDANEAKQAALTRFARLLQSVSYTDAVVMAVADEYRTTRIFGFDEACAKTGYQIIGKLSQQEAA